MTAYNINYILKIFFMKITYNFLKKILLLYIVYKLYGNYKHKLLNKLYFIYITIFCIIKVI